MTQTWTATDFWKRNPRGDGGKEFLRNGIITDNGEDLF
jgi:hypothetical protein